MVGIKDLSDSPCVRMIHHPALILLQLRPYFYRPSLSKLISMKILETIIFRKTKKNFCNWSSYFLISLINAIENFLSPLIIQLENLNFQEGKLWEFYHFPWEIGSLKFLVYFGKWKFVDHVWKLEIFVYIMFFRRLWKMEVKIMKIISTDLVFHSWEIGSVFHNSFGKKDEK